MCHLDSEHIKPLKEYIDGNDTQIICYFRNVYDYVISALSEGLKKQEQFLESQNPIRHVMDNLNYSSILRRWEAVFGEENIRAFSYDQHKQNIMGHFCRSIGVDRKALLSDHARTSNRNISPDFTSLIFWSFTDLIRTPDDYKQILKQYKSIFKNSQVHRSAFTIEFAHFIVRNLPCAYDHEKLQPIKNYITSKPEPRFSRDQYLEKMEEFIRAVRGSQTSFWQKLRLLFN